MDTLPSFTTSGGDQIPKGYHTGTHRLRTPEETVTWARRLMRPMGITRVADVTGLDSIGIPVTMVCRPNARSLSVSQGKGLDLAAAKASGLMEAAELYHAEHITLPLRFGSYEEVRYTHRTVDVATLPSTSDSIFHPNVQVFWIEGYDLLQDEPVLIPYELVHTNFTFPPLTGSGCFAATSNGLASGNHVLEAISHGICEVVERDATSLWHLRSKEAQQKTRIDLDTVHDAACRTVLEKCAQAGVAVMAWEATTEIGIPVFECLITEQNESRLRRLYATSGMGCHPAREVALLRALTEAVQSRLTFIAGSRDDLFATDYEHAASPERLRTIHSLMDVQMSMRPFCEVPTWHGETFNADIVWELQQLKNAGITRVIMVDLTKPEFRLPVVRIVIPGLEGVDHHPCYVPGARARAITGDHS